MPSEAQARPPGRPPSLTPQVHGRIVAAVRAGNYVSTALALAGVPRSTYYGPAYRELRQAVEQAQAQAEAAYVSVLVDAARGRDWRAAARFLETQFPDRWGLPRYRNGRLSRSPAGR